MGQPAVYVLHFATSASNNIALTQAVASPGPLVLNGSLVTSSVAILDAPRRVLVASTGNDASATFTVTGTDRYGNAQSELLLGTNASSSYTVYDYKTVTRIAIAPAAASNVRAGTNGVASAPWCALNRHVTPGNTSLGMSVTSGAITATAEYTYDDPNGLVPSNGAIPANVFPMSGLSGVSGPVIDGVLQQPANYVRWTVNSGSGTGSFYVLQAGLSQGG